MQESNDAESVASSQGSLGPALGAESTEPIYSEIPKCPSKEDDETLKSTDLDKVIVDSAQDVNAAEVNVWENPLGADQELIEPPPKPPHTLPEAFSECNAEQPVDNEADDSGDYTPPETPLTAVTNDHEMSEEEKSDKKSGLKPTQKFDKKKVFKRDKLASYESISLEERGSTGRSTESIKEAVKAAKRARESCSVESCPRAKIVFGISAGIAVGLFCFLVLYLPFSRHGLTAVVVALISGVTISVVLGFLDATRLKCIILLVFPSVFSSGAKLSLWILLTYFLVSGPLCNFIENVRITALTRGCMMDSTYVPPTAPTAKQQTGLQRDPTTQYLIANIEQFQNLTNQLERYLNDTLSGNQDKRNRSLLSSGLVCEEQLFKAHNTCSVAFETLYKHCIQYLKRWGLHSRCSNLILRKSTCGHLSDSFIRTTCGSVNSAQQIPLTNLTLMLQKQPNPTVKPSYSQENHTDNITFGFNTADTVEEEASTKPCESLVIVKMLLPLLILVVLYEAYRYHKHYLVYNEFDNCYLTLHFGSIENTRRASGATDGLMPLKKSELQKYVQPTSCGLSRAERKSLLKYLIIFLVYATFALLLLLGDLFFYQAVTSEEPALDTQSNRTLSGCEAQLKNPDEVHTLIISVLLGLLLLSIILQAHVLRLRRYIAARFYRTREHKRITYLYYKLLEERKSFYKSTIEKINKVSEENITLSRLDAMLVLARHFPAFGKVMEFLGLSLKRCMVCGTGLNRKYVTCDTEQCGAVYCRMCFWDVESNCLGCMSGRTRAGETSDQKENEYV